MDELEAPLTGIRVLDLGQAAVGPVAAEYLAWLGADVIKVEPPDGDMVRRTRPELRGMGHTFLGNNLGKRGIVLDLKQPEEFARAEDLIRTADVLVENFRSPAVMERLGLGWERLRELNPRLVYLQSSAFGPVGPMVGMTSNEWFSQAAGGATSLNGQPGGPPEFSRGTPSIDWNGAAVNLEALLVGLWVRERTGRGLRIQNSQLQSTMFGATTRIAEFLATASRRRGSAARAATLCPTSRSRPLRATSPSAHSTSASGRGSARSSSARSWRPIRASRATRSASSIARR